MFAKSRQDKLVEQAQDLAREVSEAITPHVERARDELTPLLIDVRDQLVDVRDQVVPRLVEAKDQLGPKLADAREELAPRIAEAREQLAPHVEDAKDRLANGRLAKGVATATAAAAPVAVEARRRGAAAAAALKGAVEQEVQQTEVQKTGRKRKLLVFATLAGLGALAVQKLRGGESANWQTSYSPSPAPAAPPAPPSPSAPMAGTHVADVPVDAAPGDPVGASPGEALSDAAEEPHPVTTPDAPAEDVYVAHLEDPDRP
jgi:hypothetical protein